MLAMIAFSAHLNDEAYYGLQTLADVCGILGDVQGLKEGTEELRTEKVLFVT